MSANDSPTVMLTLAVPAELATLLTYLSTATPAAWNQIELGITHAYVQPQKLAEQWATAAATDPAWRNAQGQGYAELKRAAQAEAHWLETLQGLLYAWRQARPDDEPETE